MKNLAFSPVPIILHPVLTHLYTYLPPPQYSMVLESEHPPPAEKTGINIQYLEFPWLVKYIVLKRGKETEETMSFSTASKVVPCHLTDAVPLGTPHQPCSCGCLCRNISLQDNCGVVPPASLWCLVWSWGSHLVIQALKWIILSGLLKRFNAMSI